MKKRLLIVIALALVFTLALTLAACGGSTEQNPDSGTPSTPGGGQPPETPDGGEQTPETPGEGDEGETPTPPVTYTVTFETNGGSAVQPVTVDEGDAVAAAPETTLDGCEFGGWYFSADLSDDSLVTFPYTPAGSTTLYAKWSKILTAADLYNEVFGEDYEFVSFDTGINDLLTIAVGTTTTNPQLLFVNRNDTVELYYHRTSGLNRDGIAKATYRGNYLKDLLTFIELSSSVKTYENFSSYAIKLAEEMLSQNNQQQAVEKLASLKSEIDTYTAALYATTKDDFSRSTILNNTTAEIEFADFAAKFMPAGVTPIACYVGDLHAPVPGHFVGDYPYGGTIQLTLCYKDTSGTIFVVDTNYYVGANSGSEETMKIYTRFLEGEIEHDFRIYSQETTTIENPIWTGYTVGI